MAESGLICKILQICYNHVTRCFASGAGLNAMVPKRITQIAMDEIARRFHFSLAGYDLNGGQIASAGGDVRGLSAEDLRRFAHSKKTRVTAGENALIKVLSMDEPVMIAAVDAGAGQEAVEITDLVLHLLSCHQRVRFETEDFLRRLFTGNVSSADMTGCACELGLDQPCKRVVYVISFEGNRGMALTDRLCEDLRTGLADFVMTLRHSKVVVIHNALDAEEEEAQARESLEATVRQTAEILTEQRIRVGCGCYAKEIGALRRSYEEAVAAIETGRMFDPQKMFHRYDDLLFEHLVCHLPKPFCRWFLNESVGENFFDDLDEEMTKTATVFLDNTMNAAETSKQLFFHRNTLYYRLSNIQDQSGLDLRKFRDASIFKLGWAIHRYVKKNHVSDSEEML